MKLRCLIVDDMHPCIFPALEDKGYEVTYRPDLIKKEELLDMLPSYQGLIVRSKFFIDESILKHATALKFIARAGAGIDNLDVEAIEKRGITIFNAPEGNRDAVGEHTVGMMLCLLNKIHKADREVRNGLWKREDNRGTEIKGKVVGLIGYGHMGQAFAQRLTGFGVEVIAYDKYKTNFSDQYVKEVSLEELQKRTDILSLHIPLTEESRFMVDINFLQRFSKSIWLINTARGEIVSLNTILETLNSGKLSGAALDVLENEKINNLTEEQSRIMKALLVKDNVLFTPHVGGWSIESYEAISKVIAAKISAFTF